MHTLRLLGPPTLTTPAGTLKLERRPAAVVAYLALEDQVRKYRLAGMLWPDSGEDAAKNNMRQLLRRLRLGLGEVVVGDDPIELAGDLEVDVQRLSYLETPSLELLRQDALLLEGFEYDDAPDFEEWLTTAREELRQLRVRSARAEAERLEGMGNPKAALEYAQVWVRLEPLSEEAQRSLIRLHYALGDRGAALAAFEGFKALLDRELGIEPLPETLELARLVERGGSLPGTASQPKDAVLPAAVLRPPILAGREREWALMEEAWAAGKSIFLAGEPGVGKSRLATDFLTSKGSFIYVETRPGDFNVPYSFNNRFVRIALKRYPNYQPPAWVRQTLALWLPELGEASAAPDPALHSRYFDAMAHVFDQTGLHGEAMMVDDLQFMDDPSAQTGEYLLSSLFPLNRTDGLRGFVCCYRMGELSAATEQIHQEMIAAGMAIRIVMGPIAENAIETLLGGLGLEGAEHLVAGLSRYTGGNPLFILETLKHLIETNALEGGLPSRLAPPGKVAALVTRRLSRLSPQALSLARAAAVAGTSFDLKLATFVLERPPMELAETHHELEAAQILRGNAFVHDLVFEATLAGIPTAVQQVLNARTAQHLEGAGANPVLIAVHWEAAGEGDHAARWLIRAAEGAEDLGLYEDMVKHLERAAAVATTLPIRLNAQVHLANALGPLGKVEEAIALAKTVLLEARDPGIRERALSVLQNSYHILGRFIEAEPFIDQGLELALQAGDHERADGMRFAKARGMLRTGRYAGAAEVLGEILPRYRLRTASSDLLQVLTALGTTLCMVGQHQQALPLLREARVLADDASMGAPAVILATSTLLYGLTCAGGAEEWLEPSERLLAEGSYTIADHLRNNLGLAYLRLERAEDAARHFRVLAEKARDPNFACAAWAWLAGLEPHNAEAWVEKARDLYPQTATPAARFAAVQAAALHGSAEQKAWARRELASLERGIVPWLFHGEYDKLATTLAG